MAIIIGHFICRFQIQKIGEVPEEINYFFFLLAFFQNFTNIKYREKREAMLFNKSSFRSFNYLSYGLYIYTIAHGIICHLIGNPFKVR